MIIQSSYLLWTWENGRFSEAEMQWMNKHETGSYTGVRCAKLTNVAFCPVSGYHTWEASWGESPQPPLKQVCASPRRPLVLELRLTVRSTSDMKLGAKPRGTPSPPNLFYSHSLEWERKLTKYHNLSGRQSAVFMKFKMWTPWPSNSNLWNYSMELTMPRYVHIYKDLKILLKTKKMETN